MPPRIACVPWVPASGSGVTRGLVVSRPLEVLRVAHAAAVERLDELAQQVLHVAQAFARLVGDDLRPQAVAPRREGVVAAIPEGGIAHAQDPAVFLDDHPLAER